LASQDHIESTVERKCLSLLEIYYSSIIFELRLGTQLTK